MTLIGYARVSTDAQTNDPQIDALRAAGCAVIFEEKGSGASKARPELARALASLKVGDVLVAYKLDRLARSLSHLLEISADLDTRGAGLKILTQPIDTTSPGGRLVFQIFGSIGEFERELIRERTKAGLDAARRRGTVLGNPRIREPGTKTKIRFSRAATRLESLRASEGQWLRPVEEGRARQLTWGQVLARINRNLKGDDHWTLARLKRAVALYVKQGRLPAEILTQVPRQMASPDIAQKVALILTNKPAATLAEIADQLTANGTKPPRGGAWNTGSVQHQIKVARRMGLLAENETGQTRVAG